MPRTLQVRGGSCWTSSVVDGRLAPPMRRVVTHFAPTVAAGRSISVLVTNGDTSAVPFHQTGVAIQVQGPALRTVYTVGNGFPSGAVAVDVPVLQLQPGAGW